MTKNEFKAALTYIDNLIGDAVDIIEDIFTKLQFETNTKISVDDAGKMLDALVSLFPDEDGMVSSIDDIYNEFNELFDDDVEETNDANLWNHYIAYLHEWAEEHNEQSFCGCTPACFDEWCENECTDTWDDYIMYLQTWVQKERAKPTYLSPDYFAAWHSYEDDNECEDYDTDTCRDEVTLFLSKKDMSNTQKKYLNKWPKYVDYIDEWSAQHSNYNYYGKSPLHFAIWYDNRE